MKALFWKEWRENWLLLMMAIGVICLVAYLVQLNRDFDPKLYDIKIVFFILPIFIVLITANIFATEFRHKTMDFMLMQPISQLKLWLFKAGFGLFLILFMIFGSGLGVYLVSQIVPHPIPFNILYNFKVNEELSLVVLLSFLYASSLFISVIVSNTIVAAFGSFLIGLALLYLEAGASTIFYYDRHIERLLWVLIIILVVSSYYIFTRPDMLLTTKRIKSGFSIIIILFLIHTGIWAVMQSNYNDVFYKYPQISGIQPEIIIPSRNQVLVNVYKNSEQGYTVAYRLCLISLDKDKKYTYLPRGYTIGWLGTHLPDNKYITLFNSRKIFQLIECKLFNSSIYLLDLDTLKYKHVPTKGERIWNNITGVFWSPNGQKLIYQKRSLFSRQKQDRLVDIKTFEDKAIHDNQEMERYHLSKDNWAKDNKSYFYSSFIGYSKDQKQQIYRLTQTSIDGIVLWQNYHYQTFSRPIISPDKNWLFYSQDTSDPSESRKVYLKNLNTGESNYILSSPNVKYGLWSPDSKWIAISTISANSECSVWLVNTETKEKRMLMSVKTSNVYSHNWSSNSRKLLISITPFSKDERTEKVYDIYTNNVQEFSIQRVYFVTNTSYPDGAFLVSDGQKDSKKLYVVPLDGRPKIQIYP